MANLAGVLKQRFFDLNGYPLTGGKLYSYEAGTSTPLATYTDISQSVENPNPVILDSAGYADVWLGGTNYKFMLYDQNDVFQFSVDDVSASGVEGSVGTETIADGAVTLAKLANLSVSTNKLVNDAVTNDKLAPDAVAEENLQDASVATAKIQDGSITDEKMNAPTLAVSGATWASDTESLSITTDGKPVRIELTAAAAGDSDITWSGIGGAAPQGYIVFKRGATSLCSLRAYSSTTDGPRVLRLPPSSFAFTDLTPPAGTHTYTVEIEGTSSGVGITNVAVLAHVMR